jgi:hypothetical protein
MVIPLRKRKLIDYSPAIRPRSLPKRKKRRLLEGKNSQKSEIRFKKWKMIILLRKRLFSSN